MLSSRVVDSLLAPDAAADAEAAAEDAAALEAQLASEHEALSTEDCFSACKALASIRRATDRLCALEPGPRCERAREKAAEASARVREACPDCALAAAPTPDERQPAAAPGAVATEAAPRKGGCASCSAAGGLDVGVLAYVLAAGWVVVRAGRARRGRRC